MVRIDIRSGRSQPRANGKSIVSSEDRSDMMDLLQTFGETPLHCLTTLYKSRYGKILDCLGSQTDGGLLGYLDCMLRGIIKYKTESNGDIIISLDESKINSESEAKENIEPLLRKRRFERQMKAFFNHDSVLWKGREALLDCRNLKNELSYFEQVKMIRENECMLEVGKIRRELLRYENGIELGRFCYLVPIDVNIFPGRANVDIIYNLPEVFHIVKRNGLTMLFDGFTNTKDDLEGKNNDFFTRNPDKIVEEVIRNGLYQKTLIVMREKGLTGLKIHVWTKTMERNFYGNKKDEEKQELYEYHQLEFFMALARHGLVEISSGNEIKNDLRAFIPRKKPEQMEPIFERFHRQRSSSAPDLAR